MTFQIKEVPVKERPGISMFTIEGIMTAQRFGVEETFKELKDKYEIDRIIEIGTHFGGLSLILRMVWPDIPIYSFDINVCPNEDKLYSNNIIFVQEDVFESEVIRQVIRAPRRVLILCDGGHKKNEFTFFAEMLKHGDLIGAHDYSS